MTWMLLTLACSSANVGADAPGLDTDTDTPAEPWTAPGVGVIELETRDGVTLEADYQPSQTQGAPGIVLLHMIPPGNDRNNWPVSFVDALAAQGWSVVRLDRRGAGGSEGNPVEAYEGPHGKKDVEAAVLRLDEDGYGPIAILGASNGTTSMVDYTAWAPGERLPEPVALGFLTGGSYTENQTAMDELPAVPSVFTYSTAESQWSVAQQPLDPGSWSFLEYPGGDHGTRMFAAQPAVADDLVDFLVDILGE
jgi:pimeloyl-ACP methyl ester carboxylesterase